jgi:isopenicillin-N N-acyltransferase-like protein
VVRDAFGGRAMGLVTTAARGEAFGRECAAAVRNTVDVYARLIDLSRAPDVPERAEIEAIARGAGVSATALLAINARTELLAGAECSTVCDGATLAQNWDWHPDLAPSTLVWIVRDGERWFATLTEAGMLAKIGLNDAGLGVCLNLLESSADGGLDGVPIHILLRRVLSTCRTVDEAVALLASAPVSASSAVTVATAGAAACVELSPGGANVLPGGAHTNHFLAPPPGARDVGDAATTRVRLKVVRELPLEEALRSHRGPVCRHLIPFDPWSQRTVTLASVIMDLEACALRVAFGNPCRAPYEDVPLPQRTHVAV